MSKTFSRKDFFRMGLKKVASAATEIYDSRSLLIDATMGKKKKVAKKLPITHIQYVRPPGAKNESEFLSLCTRGDACIKACPHWVIKKAGPELGETLTGTPIILPAENPCLMCADWPCIVACKSGALQMLPESDLVRIGMARVIEVKCYMAQGQPCDYCESFCPTSPKSIRVGERGTAAIVQKDLCTGCGKCAEICPAKAIAIDDHRLSLKPAQTKVLA